MFNNVSEFDKVIWECSSFDVDGPLSSCGLGNPRPSWGGENIAVVPDPTGGNQDVLRIFFAEDSCVCDANNKGGTNFKSKPFTASSALRLQYDIMFSDNFDFVRGGKLPGFYGGDGQCSGGHYNECFSTRFMWYKDGDGAIYAYIPYETDDWFCEDEHVNCNFNYGHSFGRWTGLEFKPGQWQTLAQEITLNDPGQKNGKLALELDGTRWFEIEGLNFRDSGDLKIDTFYFSTFFGGNDMTWASPDDVYIYFKNFKVLQ